MSKESDATKRVRRDLEVALRSVLRRLADADAMCDDAVVSNASIIEAIEHTQETLLAVQAKLRGER